MTTQAIAGHAALAPTTGAWASADAGASTKRLRVLHVIPSVAASNGGPSKAIAQMEQALSDRGVDVVTVTTNDDGVGRVLAVPLGTPVPSNGATRLYFARQTEAYKLSLPLLAWVRANVRSFDLVHVHALFSFAPVAAAWVARRAGVPYIIRPLGVLNRYGMVERRSRLKAVSVGLVEHGLLRDAAAVQFTAEQERDEAEMLNVRMNGQVVPLGIELMAAGSPEPFLAAFPGLGARRLLFLSRVDQKKNIEVLLAALARSRPAIPGLSLMICGDGNTAYLAQLKQLATDLGVADCVAWAGHVEGAMKASAFAAAELFVLPSFSENFGIAAVEALGAGLPCLLGEGVAVSRQISEAQAGLAVAPTVEAVSAAINSMLADPEALRRAGERGRALAASQYSLAAMGERLAALYESVLTTRVRA